jgi:hypothetical protein
MHQPLFPPRRQSGSPYRISEEAQATIRKHWSSASSSDESSRSNKARKAEKPFFLQPRKPTFKALRKSPSLGQTMSQATAQARRMASTSIPDKRQPLVAKPGPSSRGNDEIPSPDAATLVCNRPATPRTKTRGVIQNLPLRALSTPVSHLSLQSSKGQRRKSDHQVNKASRRPLSPTNVRGNFLSTLSADDRSRARFPASPDMINSATFTPAQRMDQSDAFKVNSGLKLRTPKSARLRYTPVSSSKKRRMSIYELNDDEAIEDSDNERGRQRPIWQTATQVFGKSRQDWDVIASSREAESMLVPRTPSPVEGKRSVYLPRL